VCPVLTARVTATVRPNPEEVVEHRWVPLRDVRAAVATAPWAFSPWMVAQLGEVDEPGGPGWSSVTGSVSGSVEGAG
jgi:isopentenyl-diphosphate Delta-isomerase